MKIGALVLALLVTASAHPLTSPRVPACATTAKHSRWSIKTRALGETEIIEETTVDAVLARIPPPPAVDVDNQPQDAFEQTAWHLTAVACAVKQSRDDCDLHVEIAATPAACVTGPRLIVELPAAFGREAQETLLDAVGIRILGRRAVTLAPPPAIQVVGFGFYDYAHRCATDPEHGCQHGSALVGSLAELHPARVEAAR